jgi:hypothetical protein
LLLLREAVATPFFLSYIILEYKLKIKKGRYATEKSRGCIVLRILILILLIENCLNFLIVTSMLKFGRQVGLRNS